MVKKWDEKISDGKRSFTGEAKNHVFGRLMTSEQKSKFTGQLRDLVNPSMHLEGRGFTWSGAASERLFIFSEQLFVERSVHFW